MKHLVFVILVSSLIVSMTRGASALPSRDASIVVPLLKKLDPPPRIAVVEEILGRRDQDVGSGVFILTFRLSDDSLIMVGSTDGKVVSWIKRTKSGNPLEVIFDAARSKA